MHRYSFNVGDVVNVGLRIYRDRFQYYFKLALIGSLWSLVPIYGWAKYGATTGLISRLAFFEVVEKPETVNQAHNRVNPRLWNFFIGGLLVLLILSLFIVTLTVVAVILAVIVGNQGFAALISFLYVFLGFPLFIWVFTRLSLVDVCLGIELINTSKAIHRSWLLTKWFTERLQTIYFVAFLIFGPLIYMNMIFLAWVNYLLLIRFGLENSRLLFNCISMIIIIFLNSLSLPFWQSIKSVIYYDLRCQREGLDLEN